jgi:site-specific recombinase XerD
MTTPGATDLPRVKGETEIAGRSLTIEELRSLFKVCDADPSPAGIRDAALIAVMYCTGLRRNEVVALTLADYDKDKSLTVRGKGNKTRMAFLTADAQCRLNEWLKVRGHERKPLFVSISKAGILGTEPLTGHSIRFILQGRALDGGVKPFSPHDMRRTTATHLLDHGIDLSIVQKLLGHRHLTTTSLYDRRGEAAKKKAADDLGAFFSDNQKGRISAI